MNKTKAITPEVTWAQRSNEHILEKNIVYLNILIPDAKDIEIELTSNKLKLNAYNDKNSYELDLQFYGDIDPEASKKTETGRGISYILQKVKCEKDYWPRLSNEKHRLRFIKTDFDKWVDEDEQDEEPAAEEDMGMGGQGLDFSQLGGAGGAGGPPGAGGMGGMDMASMMQAMGGAGGAGGPPGGAGGMDMAAMMQAMGGAGGAGGPPGGAGGMDMEALMKQMGGGAGGAGGFDMSKLAGLAGGAGAEGEEGEEAEELPELKEDK